MYKLLKMFSLIGVSATLCLPSASVTAAPARVQPKLLFDSFAPAPSGGAVSDMDIWVANEDGSGLKKLTDSPDYDGTASWSPRGRRIAFHSDRHGNDDIFVMNGDGSAQTRLTSSKVPERWATWSPNGKRIAYGKGSELWVMNADGSNKRKIYRSRGETVRLSDWSPDGRWLGFTVGNCRCHGDWDILVVHPDGSGLKKLVDSKRDEEGVTWSPDGNSIAFHRFAGCDDKPECQWDIFVAAANGTNQENLTDNPLSWEFDPAWSPDGTQIAFSADDYTGFVVDIFVMNSDGSNRRSLVTKVDSLEYSVDWQR